MTDKYEIVVVTNPDLDEAGVQGELEKIKATIESHKGKIENRDSWGKRQLSYQIDKRSFGHYDLMVFSADGSVVAELERQLKIEDNVLRHLIVKKDKYAPDGRPTDQDEEGEESTSSAAGSSSPASSSGTVKPVVAADAAAKAGDSAGTEAKPAAE